MTLVNTFKLTLHRGVTIVARVLAVISLASVGAAAETIDEQIERAYEQGNYEVASQLLSAQVARDHAAGRRDYDAAQRLTNLSAVCVEREQFDSAIVFGRTALAMFDSLKHPVAAAMCLVNIGIVHKTRGNYDSALSAYDSALARAADDSTSRKTVHTNLGVLYKNWGRYDKALGHYHDALAIAERRSDTVSAIRLHNNIAGIYHITDKPYRAREHLDKALALARNLGHRRFEAIITENAGRMLFERGRLDSAASMYRAALAVYREMNASEGITMALDALGSVLERRNAFDSALATYRASLAHARSFNSRPHIATALSRIGVVYWRTGDYPRAIDSLRAAVDILEQLRVTASGDIRRDYLSSQIDSYQWLASALVRAGNHPAALDVIEQSSAKYLAEQTGSGTAMSFSGAVRYTASLPPRTLIVRFSNVGAQSGLLRASISRDNLRIVERRADSIPIPAGARSTAFTNRFALRGIAVTARERSGTTSLAEAVEAYRQLLARPSSDSLTLSAMRHLGRTLYDTLMGGLDSLISDAQELTIVPDGFLGTLPFEALVTPDGSFLIERIPVRYAFSLTVDEIISKRSHTPPKKSLLAYGGAVYAAPERPTQTASLTPERTEEIRRASRSAKRGGSSFTSVFANTGLDKWENLPGTLAEVTRLGKMFKGATIETGTDVNEQRVLDASRSGELARYRYLHFATHGVVVPDIAELSALVLSNAGTQTGGTDGYLMMHEVSTLRLAADIVTLSACETGLGKIYGGEGVVGLSQAFVIAGARAVVSSLWQVADESTARFMIDFYGLIERKPGMAQALADVKRAFIDGKAGAQYTHPFFWAPFVAYGR